jgi:tRNA (cytidine/uridine-2'-O-)-methyltransferase
MATGDNHCMFNVVLVTPEIPPNTGNIIRLCANTGSRLHLIEPLGFDMRDKHEYSPVSRYANWQAFLETATPQARRMFAFTTKGLASPYQQAFQAGDWFVFGSETQGLPADLRESFAPEQRLRLPMIEGQRSLNLSNAVAVTVFEAWRQCGFKT